MKPEDVTYMTELARDFSQALMKVDSENSFGDFLLKWKYWLDKETKEYVKHDWEWLKPLIDDCRTEGVIPEDRHEPAIKLIMPKNIVIISIMADRFKVPWGCIYINMKEDVLLDF